MIKRTSVILNWYMRNAAAIKAAVEKEREECVITLIDIALMHPDRQCRDALRIAAYEILDRANNG